MVPSKSEITSDRCSMKRKVLFQFESGACNVCGAPCSSCMHLNQPLMVSKTDEFSDETSRINMTSQNSINGGDVSSSPKRRACGSVQNTTSETSNLISVNSNQDSLSESADSKPIPRCVDLTDAVEVKTHPKLSSVENAERLEQYPKTRACSNRHEDSRFTHDDNNMSCLGRANDACVADSNQSRNTNKKNLSCSSASVSSLNQECARRAHEPILSCLPSAKHTISQSNSQKEKAPAECHRGLVDQEPSPKEAATGDSKSGSHEHSDISSDMFLNPAETSNGEGKPTDQVSKCEQYGKSSNFNMQEPPNQSVSGYESDESDIVEHDVKVCDICGDAGREDLLAICSRCSDGAEHTYCMQKMLKKVPRGNWLCEECKLAQEMNSQKQVAEVEGKRTNKASSSMQYSRKRLADNAEKAPVAIRQALETSVASPKSSSPVKPLRESSFKNLDREKHRPVQQTSVGSHSNDIVETPRSATTIPRLQTLKGIMSKSNSFNTFSSKPKVKLVDEVIPQKKKGPKEQTSMDTIGRPTRVLGKSMSFKPTTLGRPNTSDSKVKMLSPKELNYVIDPKGLKQPKERTAFERKALTKIDCPVVCSTPTGSTVSTPKVDHQSHVESSSTSSLTNNRDLKAVHCEGKSSNPSKLEGNLARKPKLSVGISSINRGRSSDAEQILSHLSAKDESLSSYALINEKSQNNVDGSSHDGLPQSLELAHQVELTRDDDFVCQRPTYATCSEADVSHAAEFDTIGDYQASGTDAFATRISRDEMQCGSRLKDAIQAALLRKPELCKKKKVLEQSDEFSTSNTDISCEATIQNHLLASINLKNSLSSERLNEGESILGSPTPESYMHSTGNSLIWHSVPSKIGDSDVSSLGKPMSKDFLNLASATSSLLLKTPAIPEYEYIWQGYFEVHRSGNYRDLSGGIQAHLSTCASPKVLEVAEKFPQNLSLHEVSRLSTWPTQFQESDATEDNIALYFFAKDEESYDRSYKGLVDGMIKSDLALKGQFEGVELLIFPSNQLPEKSRRWNMLFYLWGVFRARRMHNSDSSKEFPDLSSVSVEKQPPSVLMTLSDNLCSLEQMHKKSPAFDRSNSIKFAATLFDRASEIASANCKDKKPPAEKLLISSNANTVPHDGRLHFESTCRASSGKEIRGTSLSLEENILPNQSLGVEVKPPFLATVTNNYREGEKMDLHCNTCDKNDTLSLNILPVSNQEVGVAGSVCEKKISNERVGDETNLDRMSKEMDHYKVRSKMKDDRHVNKTAFLARDLNSQGCNTFQSNHRNPSHIHLSDSLPSASTVTNQTMPWYGGNNVLVDGASISKKPTTGLSNIYDCSIYSGITPDGEGMASRITALGPCSFEERKYVDACEEKVILEDMGTSESYFFPVNSCHKSGDNSVLRKSFSAVSDCFNNGFPNLELALGADTKPQNKGMLPFLVGLADKSDTEDKPPDKVIHDKEDDASASLSLSLSFPFPDKEEPVSKSEQLRPEKRHADTSLLLFGGLSEK